jgi:hypothetical protein
LSVSGIPNKTSFWSFKFDVKSIVNKRDGTISKFQEQIIDKESEDFKNVSRFLSFFPTTNKFSLKFKNVKIKKKIDVNNLTVKIKVSNELNKIGISSKLGRKFITDRLTMPQVSGSTYDFDYSASNAKVINESGDTPKHTTVVGDFLTRCADIIDIKHVQLIFMFFYLISQKSVKDSLCGSKVYNPASKHPECSIPFFNAISTLPFLNFLPVVYKTINRLPTMNPLSFQDIIANMKQTAGASGIELQFDYVGEVDDAIERTRRKSGAAKASVDDGSSTRALDSSLSRGILTPVGSSKDRTVDSTLEGGSVSNYQTGGGDDEDLFKYISRIIPMQIDEFNATPQTMTVTITRPKLMAPYCQPTLPDESSSDESSRKNPESLSRNTANLQNGDSDKTKKYISKSLLEGQVTISVGDVVRFISDGHVVKAIVCYFKSGKLRYGTGGNGYEAASNIRDYYASMKDKGMNEAIAEKKSEPVNLIHLINLRGFAYLPIDDDGNILYDCKSKLLRLHNGYRPMKKTSERLKSIGRLMTPGSTEFRVGDIKDTLFNTESLMTLIKEYDADVEQKDSPKQKQIQNIPKIKDFVTFLRGDDMGNSAEDVIIEKIQKYIQQNGLSKQCGKSSSPNANDVKRMNFFQHKCQEINARFITAGILGEATNQYNVYKSNEFIQSLLTEKISDSDSTALFQMPYNPPVPELIFWFFTRVASIDVLRAMIMIFQAFARDNADTGFKPAELLKVDNKPGQKTPNATSFTVAAQGGGGAEGLEMAMGQSGGKWLKGEPQPPVNGKATGNYEWYDDVSKAVYVGEDGNIAYSEYAPMVEQVKERTSADLISGYIERLIAIIRINNLNKDDYLKFLTSQLTAAKIKYKSTDIDNRFLFSSSIATQHQAEAIMEQHKLKAANDINEAKTARETARQSAIDESEAAKDREADRQARIAEASNGKGTTASRNPFDLRSIFNQKSGSNINNELGTCISGNNAVISCDGKTIRIDLDLAALLSTCGDNIAPTDDDAAKVAAEERAAAEAKAAAAAAAEQERLNVAAAAAAAAEEEEKQRLEEEKQRLAAEAAKSDKPKADATVAAEDAKSDKPEAAAAAAQTDATAKYNAYVADYDKFINDPVVKYVEYNAAYEKFMRDASTAGLKVNDDEAL